MDPIGWLQWIGGRWLRRAVRQQIRDRQQAQDEIVRADEKALLRTTDTASSIISLGRTTTGTDLRVSIDQLFAHGIVVGATGSGKTRAALGLLRQFLDGAAHGRCGVGVIDLKNEFYTHALSFCDRESRMPIFTLDLSHRHAVIGYDLLVAQHGETNAELIARRMETLGDFLEDSDPSLRMRRMLRHCLSLLVESNLGFAILDHIVEDPDVAVRLASKSRDDRVRRYFQGDFLKERSVTLPALRVRLDGLLSQESVRLSLSAGEQFDFAHAMDSGGVVLINLAGVGNKTAKVFQSLLLSDLRQAIFARKKKSLPYLWLCDEAQLLLRQPSDKSALAEILTLSRSAGVHLLLITQSLRSAISDSEFFQVFETNLKWLLLLRSGVADAAIIRPGLRPTGTVRKGLSSGRATYLTPDQEVQHTLNEIANLPAREGYVWIRGTGAKAVRVTTPHVADVAAPVEKKPSSELADRVRARLAEQEKFLASLNVENRPNSVSNFLHRLEKEYPSK